MSPSEPESTTQTGGAATAEAEAPGTPQLGEPLAGPQTPVEEPTPEQEQPKEEAAEAPDKGDSETQEEEEAPSIEDGIAALAELAKSNPEVAKALQDRLGAGDDSRQREFDLELSKRELAQDQETRKTSLTQAEQAVAPYMPTSIQEVSRQYGDQLAKQVEGDAKAAIAAAAAGNEYDTGLVDAAAIAQTVSGYVGSAIASWNSYQARFNADIAFGALEADEAHAHLTADDKKALKAIKAKSFTEGLPEALSIYLGAARRSAPVVKGAKEAKKTAADLELAKQLATITNALGTNGARKLGGDAPATTQPRNETEARNLHATGKWTGRQMREYLARPKA